ncbi:DUF4041 domain-containing protein [Acetobacterium paludosum]|uniref:DUF4041 domain-containing protein n=2 Tax=Acetobacterium paludosum TaxID=52693 RepID=A0A923HZH4_9FIRM|nr:DUF4041 domain-containing protein [Acetobacterium paludosum]
MKVKYEKIVGSLLIEGEQNKIDVGSLKEQLTVIEEKNNKLETMLTPEMLEAEKQRTIIAELEVKRKTINDDISGLLIRKTEKEKEISELIKKAQSLKEDIIQLDDEILYQSFGVYTPVYNLMSSEVYKDHITANRYSQKQLIKNDTATTYSTGMTLDGDLKKGQRMVKDSVKQVLRSFNNECDAAISGVKFNNVVSIEKRIQKSRESLEKLNKAMSIKIKNDYYNLKIEELRLCHEYAIKKQEEKETAKAEREALREEAKLQKELEETRKNIVKEQLHYKTALERVEIQIAGSTNVSEELLTKKEELMGKLLDIDAAIEDLDYREANKRAGYVYVISNVGSFGEDVYKIGMTRRLEPLDRVNELGDASVPFNFDLHAMIFSDDAPTLESALHQAFEHKKVNMVNQRREFFRVSLDEIEEVVNKNYDKTVEFLKIPEAEQYRESVMLKKEYQSA